MLLPNKIIKTFKIEPFQYDFTIKKNMLVRSAMESEYEDFFFSYTILTIFVFSNIKTSDSYVFYLVLSGILGKL